MKISVVIPVFNEEKRIKNTADVLDGYMKSNFDNYEIVFSNDGSTDKTFEYAKEISNVNPRIKTVGYTENKGKGMAVKNGILNSEGDFILFTDCDLAYGTDVIKSAFTLFTESGADIVIGSRNLSSDSYKGYTWLRQVTSKVYFKIIALVSGFKHSDSQCGFKCFSKKAAYDIFPECEITSFAFDLEALIKAQNKGYKIAELPVKIISNDNRDSKVRVVRDSLKMLGDIRKIKKKNKKTRK